MHARRFERACAEEIATRLRRVQLEDPANARMIAKREAKAALGRRDAKALVGACEAWRELQPLPPAYNSLFANALIAEERFEEAHAILASGKVPARDHAYFHDLALALTGCGRLTEALVAAIKAKAALPDVDLEGTKLDDAVAALARGRTSLDLAARKPGYRTAIERQMALGKRAFAAAQLRQFMAERTEVLLAALTRAATAQAGARPPADWFSARRLTEAYLALGMGAQAADCLSAALEKSVELARDDSEAVFALAAAATPRLDLPALDRLVRVLDPLCKGKAERIAMGGVRRALMPGTPPDPLSPKADPGRLRKDVRSFLGLACATAQRYEIAIDLLGRLAERQRPDAPYLAELARCVGEETIRRLRVTPQPRAQRRIFDLFPYNGEQQVLEIKLNEMAGWVDRFVIVESLQTFAGGPKPTHFGLSRERFAPWADRIEHVVVEAFPDHVTTPWARAFHQRDQALRAIADCAPDDLVLLTDVDEIIDRRAIDSFTDEFAGLQLQAFRHFLNYRQAPAPEPAHGGPSVWRARYLAKVGPSYARHVLAPRMAPDRIPDAGWRFAAVADPDEAGRAGHGQSVPPAGGRRAAVWDQASAALLVDAVRRGRIEPGWERWEIDERFPDFVRRNRERLAALIL